MRRQREAADVIAQFHQRFNAGEFNKICDDAFACRGSTDLRKAWQALLEDVRNRAGSFRSVSHSDIKVYIEPPSVQANVVSVFEKTELRETFVMNDYDGPLRIITYKTTTKDAAGVSQQGLNQLAAFSLLCNAGTSRPAQQDAEGQTYRP